MASAKGFRWTSLLALAVLLFVPALAVGQTLVLGQVANNTSAANTDTVTVTYPNPETAGDLNVVIVGWSDTSSTVTSVTDDNGNPYQVAAGTNASSGESQVIYFAKNIQLGTTGTTTAPTVKVTFNQVATAPDVRILEYSGLDTLQPLDNSAGAPGSGSSGTIANSGPATINNATDILIGSGTTSSSFTQAGSGFNKIVITQPFADIVEDKSVSSTGTYNATATTSGGNWVMQMAAFSTTTVSVVGTPIITTLSPTSGPDTGGTAVTITGANFQTGAVVLFGGVSAVNCTVVSATSITCSSPTNPIGAANVTVQNVDGTPSLAATFTYTKSAPIVSKVTPAQGITNGGNLVTITGSSFVGPASVTFGGLPASNVSVVNSTTITATPPAHAQGAVGVVVTNADTGVSPPLSGYTYVLGTGPVNFIQSKALGSSSGTHTTWAVTLDNPQTGGDLTVVVVGWSNAGDVSQVTDDASNAYTRALLTSTNVGGNISQTIYYAKNITSSSTITVTFTQATGAPDLRVMEYRGLDPANPLDLSTAAAASTLGSGTLAVGGSVSTGFTNNLIVAGAMVGRTVVGTGNNFLATAISNDGNGAAHQINPSRVSGAFATFNIKPSAPWIVQEVTFHASASAPQPNYTLGASPSSTSVAAGSSATYSISATGQDGFSSAVSLACSGPAGVGISCSVSPSSITPGGAPATLSVTTTGPTAALYAPQRRKMLPLYAIWLPLPGMALAGIGYASRKRKLAIGMTLFLVLGLTLLLAGCGGGGSSSGGGGGGGGGGGTSAGTYTITVTGTSGSLSHSTQVTLTVQ